MKNTLKLAIISILVSLSSCKYEEVNLVAQADIITKGSQLYSFLTNITTDSDDPLQNINCIHFNYSFYIFTYDVSYNIVNQILVSTNQEFSDVLTNLPDGQSISISYPISATLDDGTVYVIETNEDLLNSIQNCREQEILNICYGIAMQCQWVIPFLENENNTYASSLLRFTEPGLFILQHQQQNHYGHWVFLENNNQLQANIFFSENNTISNDWNFNYKVVEITHYKMVLENSENQKRHTFTRICEQTDEYAIGDLGPDKGIVAYDKSEYLNGWRYIEVQNQDLAMEQWGCLNSDLTITENDFIGSGWQSSIAVANYHINLDNYFENPSICDPSNDGTVTALSALLYQNSSGLNWFLPSFEELQLLYQNLHLQGLGNFSDTVYWSSTQASEMTVKGLDFSTGEMIILPKNSPQVHSRAIRYF